MIYAMNKTLPFWVKFTWVWPAVIALSLLIGCSDKATELAEGKTLAASNPSTNVDVASDLMWVYIDNGAVQCEYSGKTLLETRTQLSDSNIPVAQSHCAQITGAMVASQCGLKDVNIHVHQIPNSHIKQARGTGFEPVTNLSHYGNKSYTLTECGNG